MEHHPCSKTSRKLVYENARKCKMITIKKCKADPKKKKTCKTARKGISRLRKRELCSYIVGSPAYRTEGELKKKNFKNVELRSNLSNRLEREFFSAKKIEIKNRKKGSIGDAQRTLYLAQFSGKDTLIYEEKGGSKAYWTNYDEDEDEYLDDWRLTFPTHFEEVVRQARRRGIKRIFINMRLHEQEEENPEDPSTHSNFLLLDLTHSLLYRYEPSGYGKVYEIYNMNKLDSELTKWARKHRLSYIPPWDSCPSQLLGKVATIQRQAGKAKKEEADPGGFCKVWATFMLEQKLRHPEMDMDTIQRNILQLFKDNKVDMLQFARKYIERINQYGNEILQADGRKEEEDADEYLEKHWTSLMKSTQKKESMIDIAS